jgi:hypothetical protein
MSVPNNVSVFCPHCGQRTAVSAAPLSIVVSSPNTPPNNIREANIREFLASDPYYRYGPHNWWLGKCNACQQPMVVRDIGAIVYPAPQPGPVSEDIPEPMRSDLREAKQCLSVGAWNAAVVMARRALQCAAVERGAPAGAKLWRQIAWLDENRKITSDQRRWADVARWVGNDGAHNTEPAVADGDPVIVGVSEEEARDSIKLVEHLFETLYVAKKVADAHHARRRPAED